MNMSIKKKETKVILANRVFAIEVNVGGKNIRKKEGECGKTWF